MLMPHNKLVNDNVRNQGKSRIIHRPIPLTAAPANASPFELVVPRISTRSSNEVGELNLLNQWFHGSISRDDTEKLLKHNGQNGTFLIRFSGSTHKYVLSVIHNQQMYHYPIEELSDGFYQVSIFCFF